jgi:lipoprotein-releasing system permease protein
VRALAVPRGPLRPLRVQASSVGVGLLVRQQRMLGLPTPAPHALEPMTPLGPGAGLGRSLPMGVGQKVVQGFQLGVGARRQLRCHNAACIMSGLTLPFAWRIGWRYTRARRAGRRNGFIGFISSVSMLGICLGVAALIVVLSVMNGFQHEVRDRMLSVLPHLEVERLDGAALADPQIVANRLQALPQVMATAPYVALQGLLSRGDVLRGVMLRGIDPRHEPQVTALARDMAQQVFAQLQPGAFGVVLGQVLAQNLGVGRGDSLVLMLPSMQPTPAGLMPRLRTVRVMGVFRSGHYEFDATMAWMHVDDAARLMRLAGPSGVRARLQDPLQARATAPTVQARLGADYVVRDWTQTNRTWFAAVQVEKRMMGIILTLIVAVAAFNLVSTLVMTVTDKRGDIAILRTLGVSPLGIMAIFVVQGAIVGALGTLLGLGVGLLVATHVDVIVPALEALFDTQFLPQDVYLISTMPSDPQAADIVPVVVVSLVLSWLATLYPAWMASRVQPAEALRHE